MAVGACLLMLAATGASATAATRYGPLFADNFSGPAGSLPNPSIWSADTGGAWGNGRELEAYTASPRNASLDGHGNLLITARRETYTGLDGITRAYTSARLQTWRKFDFTYGRVSARIRLPQGSGLLPQFWALGDDAYAARDWPASGEIDVMEMLGSNPLVVYGTIHGPTSASPNGYQVQGAFTSASSLTAGFHVYSADWSPGAIRFAVDGHTYRTVTPANLPHGASWPFNHPFFLVLDLTVGGPWAGPPGFTTAWPATMAVDWVKVSPTTLGAVSAASQSGRRRRGHAAGARRP